MFVIIIGKYIRLVYNISSNNNRLTEISPIDTRIPGLFVIIIIIIIIIIISDKLTIW